MQSELMVVPLDPPEWREGDIWLFENCAMSFYSMSRAEMDLKFPPKDLTDAE